MIEHHLQRSIIAKLVESEEARYADLKPRHIDGNVFTYHLSSMLKQKYIQKLPNGKYRLTNKGKLYGINIALNKQDLLAQAHSIILLSVQENNRWLLRKRLVQPMFNKYGFIHGEPMAGEDVITAAARILKRRTDLSAKLTFKGSGYITLEDDEGIVAFSHFSLIEAANLKGELNNIDSHGENVWLDSPDFSSDSMIPSMQDLVAMINKPGLFFLDKRYKIATDKSRNDP